MALTYKTIKFKFFELLPLFLLFFISLNGSSVIDLKFFSINIHYILVYYWVLRQPQSLGYGFIFLCGIINDVVLSLPLCVSALSYLFVTLVAAYVKNATVRSTLFTDWFTFLIAVLIGNFTTYLLLNKFTETRIEYDSMFFNSLFTFILYPAFWLTFEVYKRLINLKTYD